MIGFKPQCGWIVSIGALLLAGCASAPQPAPVVTAPVAGIQQPLARLPAPPTPRAAVMAAVMQGDFALAHNDLAGAARAYANAARQSANPTLARRAFELAIAARDLPLARQALSRWQVLGAAALDLEAGRAALALAAGDRADAQATLLRLIAQGTHGWRAALRVLARARDRGMAAQVLMRVATPDTLPARQPALWLACGQLGVQLGQPAYARALAQALLRRTDTAFAYAWLAQLQQSAGQPDAAAATLNSGLRRHPLDATLRLTRAVQLAQRQPAQALRLLARGPQNHDTYALRAALAARMNDTAALRALYAQMTRQPAAQQRADAWLLGQLAEWLRRPRAALRWYDAVPSASAHGFAADLRRAVLLDQLGQTAQARALAADLAEQSFEDPRQYRQATVLQAELAYAARDYAAAIAAYNRALLFDPDAWDLIYARGVVLADAGHTAAALRDFRAVLAAQPDNIDALNALGFTLADANRDLPEARSLLARALAARPGNAAIIDSWGWLQYRLGDYPLAISTLRKAWQLDRSAEIGAHLARALQAGGQHLQARRVLAQALKLDPRSRAAQAARREIGT